jgi:hypothetical protein
MANDNFDKTMKLKATASRIAPSVDARILTLGQNLQVVRMTVYRESLAQFSVRIGVCINTLRKMEAGHPGVAIGTWMQGFTFMQVDSDVVDASRPDALLFSSSFTHPHPVSGI